MQTHPGLFAQLHLHVQLCPHGLLSVVQIHPGLFASAAPWLSGAAFKQVLSTYSNAAVACTYTRDVGSGQVKIDKDGRPRLHYVLGKEDTDNIWKVCEPTCLPHVSKAVKHIAKKGQSDSQLALCHGKHNVSDV